MGSPFFYAQAVRELRYIFVCEHETKHMNPSITIPVLSMILGGSLHEIDLSQPLDLSLPLIADREGPSAWYVDPLRIEPVRGNGWVGAVAEGGSVNFRDIAFNPHGHGTHTECVGHITEVVHSVNEVVFPAFMEALVITVAPQILANGDAVIGAETLRNAVPITGAAAVVIRTLPNDPQKQIRNWSHTNPTYFDPEGLAYLADVGVAHLLVDLPSVDREEDGGALAAHRAFWQLDSLNAPRMEATITEFIFVSDEVTDGWYALNLQTASFVNDATPSRPVLYPVAK
jgi:arylformamidase